MIKISEKWSISGSRNDFTLTESLVRKDEKTGKEKVVERSTYHPTIEQCLRKIVRAETFQTVVTSDAIAATELLEHLEVITNTIKESARAIEAATQPTSTKSDVE